ncbi:MAG: hypothetical protein ACLFPS_09080 [Clostridia bacterium]
MPCFVGIIITVQGKDFADGLNYNIIRLTKPRCYKMMLASKLHRATNKSTTKGLTWGEVAK